MHAPSLTCSSLLLASGLFLAVQTKKWDQTFDYTNLPPSNAELWAPLQTVTVPLEKAIEVAAQTEGAPVRLLRAELKAGDSGPVWYMQLFVGKDEERPKRVNLQVSGLEPKVVRRLELLAIVADEDTAWFELVKAQVAPEIAIQLAKESTIGTKAEPILEDARARRIEFVFKDITKDITPIWECEIMGFETKKTQIRRFGVQVMSEQPRAKQKLMLDRFAGEPLRSGEPTKLDNGMYVFDFHEGSGDPLTADSKVKVNYRLFLLDNTKLHDTWKDKKPETYLVSEMPLEGMSLGLAGMRVGGKRKIAMPYSLAFGEAGNEIAPPKAMVVCDLVVQELVTE